MPETKGPVLGKMMPAKTVEFQHEQFHEIKKLLMPIAGNAVAKAMAELPQGRQMEMPMHGLAKNMAESSFDAFVFSIEFLRKVMEESYDKNKEKPDYLIIPLGCSLGDDGRKEGEPVAILMGGVYQKQSPEEEANLGMKFNPTFSKDGETPEHPGRTIARFDRKFFNAEDNDSFYIK